MLKQANKLFQQDKTQQAIKLYDQFLSTKPQKDDLLIALYNKALALDQLKKYKQGADVYQQIIQIDPQYRKSEIYFNQGQLYQFAGLNNDCKQAYLKYLNYYPNHVECIYNLAVVYQSLGQLDNALKCLQKACNLKSDYIKAYKKKIFILKKLSRYQQIIKTCEKALQQQPIDAQLKFEQGFAYFQIKSFPLAISCFNDSIQFNKNYVRPYIMLGQILYRTGKQQESIEIYQKCLNINKNSIKQNESIQIYNNMAIINMSLKKYKQAIGFFKRFVTLNSSLSIKIKLATCLQQQGHFYFDKKNYADSLMCYNQALKYDQNRISLINNIGLTYQNLNKYDEAEKYYRKVLSIDPKNQIALKNLATLFNAQGKKQNTNQMLDKLLKQSPQNSAAHINKGKFYMGVKKYSQALKQFKYAQKHQGKNYNLFNDMAVALQNLQNYQEALYYAQLANKLSNEQSPLILLNRASIQMKLKKVKQARTDLDKISKHMTNNDKSFMLKFGITSQNLKFIFNQLDHYAYLMSPINNFRTQFASQIVKQIKKQQRKIIQQKIQKAQQYAISRIMQNIKIENTTNITKRDPNQSRTDYDTIQNILSQAQKQVSKMKQQMISMKRQMSQLKRHSADLQQKINNILKSIPMSVQLRKTFDMLKLQNPMIYRYGKQLYWLLDSYFTGFLLVATGIVMKGDKIQKSDLGQAMQKVQKISEASKIIPFIGDAFQMIGKICGVFADKEDQFIVDRIFQIISINYDTKQDLNDAICEIVLMFINDPNKCRKIKSQIFYDPPKGFFEKLDANIQQVKEWYQQKKRQFFSHLKGYKDVRKLQQNKLALMDVGLLVSTLLQMPFNVNKKQKMLQKAAQKLLKQCPAQNLVYQAYMRQQNSIRKSNNSYCTIYKTLIIYENPLLNNFQFLDYVKKQNISFINIVKLDKNYFKTIQQLLQFGLYQYITDIIFKNQI